MDDPGYSACLYSSLLDGGQLSAGYEGPAEPETLPNGMQRNITYRADHRSSLRLNLGRS